MKQNGGQHVASEADPDPIRARMEAFNRLGHMEKLAQFEQLLAERDATIEVARQYREAVSNWEAAHKARSEGAPNDAEWLSLGTAVWEAENALRELAATPPDGESALARAAKLETALREIGICFAVCAHCRDITKAALVPTEGRS